MFHNNFGNTTIGSYANVVGGNTVQGGEKAPKVQEVSFLISGQSVMIGFEDASFLKMPKDTVTKFLANNGFNPLQAGVVASYWMRESQMCKLVSSHA